MMRIAFISRLNLIGGRTNVYNFSKTCEAINTGNGFMATLITTDQKRDLNVYFQKMAIHQPFDVVVLGVTDTLSPQGGQRWHEIKSFIAANFHLAKYVYKNRKNIDIVYFRDDSLFLTAWFARGFLNKKVFFEVHAVYQKKLRQMKNVIGAWVSNGVIGISTGVRDHYQKINKNIIVSLCSAPEDSWFDHAKSKEYFRKQLGLPADSFLIGYIGVVGFNPNNDYYEVDDVIRSLTLLPKDSMLVVGGEIDKNADWLRTVARSAGVSDRVIFLPWIERKIVPQYLQAFDVHVIPKRKKNLVGDSPAKMFPSLAAKRPIIAGRAESIEEVLTDGFDAVIVKTNDPQGWAEAIKKVKDDPVFAQKIVSGAEVTKTKYTWEKRGEAISEFIRKTIKENR